MEKNWGSGLKAAIESAEKLKIAFNNFKGYEKACKNLDEMEKIYGLITPALGDVEKFVASPDPAAARDVAQFFKYKDDYVRLAKETSSIIDKGMLLNVADELKEQEKAKNKDGIAVYKTIKDRVQTLQGILNPGDNSVLFKDTEAFKKQAKKNYEERLKDAAKELAARQEKERKAFDTQGVTDWQAIYAALDGK
jgi:hypothetical protein